MIAFYVTGFSIISEIVVVPLGAKVMMLPALREALLGVPEIARRLGSVPINIHDRHTHFLQSPDGPAVIAKRGLREYWFLAPGLEQADPPADRLGILHDRCDVPVVRHAKDLAAELGADFRGNFSKLMPDYGKVSLQQFRMWRLSVEARLERHEPIRVEGGRVRRALQKASGLENIGTAARRNPRGADWRLAGSEIEHSSSVGQLTE